MEYLVDLRHKLLDRQIVYALDQGYHVAVLLPLPSRQFEVHKDFNTRSVMHSSPREQTPADQPQHLFKSPDCLISISLLAGLL